MKRPLMYLVRHGTTTDSGLNIYRGQRDSMLDKKGFVGAHALKEFFKELSWDRIFCSPMSRSIQTATIICDDQEEYQPEVLPGLEPWNIGYLTGQPKNEKNNALIKYFDENMNEVPKGGESIHQFQARIWTILVAGIQLGWQNKIPCIMVAHSSIIHSLNHLLVGYQHDDISVEPGGVVEVYAENNEILHHSIFLEGKDDSSFQYRS